MMRTSSEVEREAVISEKVPSLLEAVTRLADSYHFDRSADSENLFPAQELVYLREQGLLKAVMPVTWGGSGLGIDAGSHVHLLHLLKELGRANLSLARIFEGHANAIHLINAYGNTEQQGAAANDCLCGRLFAVWNTDATEPVRLVTTSSGSWELTGTKAFASAARWAERPLVMADKGSEGRQMCLLRREEMASLIDQTSWRPIGMEGTESYQIDVTGTPVDESALIGNPNDYYAAPLFLGGSIRMSAVLLGGAEALFHYLRSYLRFVGQTARPLQQLRVARIYAAIESGRGWLQFAAKEADAGLHIQADDEAAGRMNFVANAMRVAIEDICPQVIRLVSESIGARGLMQPYRFGHVIKDLIMLLRQPDPDNTFLETGRYLLEKAESRV